MVYSTAILDCCREKPQAEQYVDSLLASLPQREQMAPTVECFYTRLEKSKTGYQCVNQVQQLFFLSAGETFYLQQHFFFFICRNVLFLFAEAFFICVFRVQSLICSLHFLCSDPCGPFLDRKGTPFVYILLKNGSPFTYILTLIFLSFYAEFIKWVHASARNISVKDLL